MRNRLLGLVTIACVGLALSMANLAAEETNADNIAKLIKKLSSNRFSEREKAQQALEKIGVPALEALRKAAENADDQETRKRASELVTKLEKEVQASQVLAPTRMRLKFKDTPLNEALADIKKQTGYDIQLFDRENKLKDRTISLDTGDTTFWEGFDLFCQKAGLVEASLEDLQQLAPRAVPVLPPGVNAPFIPGQPLPPGIRIRPAQPPVLIRPAQPLRPFKKEPPAAPKSTDKPADGAKPVEKPADLPKPDKQPVPPQVEDIAIAVVQARAPVAQPPVAPPPAAAPALPPGVQIIQGVQVQPFPAIQQMRPWLQPGVTNPGQITLKEGKVKVVPTFYSGAVRIQVADELKPAWTPEGHLSVSLKISPEPKIRWQRLVALRVDKALDDQGQTLTGKLNEFEVGPQGLLPQAIPANAGNVRERLRWMPAVGGLHHYVSVLLNKGKKPSKTIKEMEGTITAEVLPAPSILMSADQVLKAAGKTIKGKESGSLKIVSAEEKDERVTVRLELEHPRDVVPAGPQGIFGMNGGPIQIVPLPALPPQNAVPLPAPLPPGNLVPLPAPLPPGGGGALQFQVAPAQAAPAQVPVQIQLAPGQPGVQIQVQQIQIGGGGAIMIGGGGAGAGNPPGLELLDEKGESIACVGSQMNGRMGAGGDFTSEYSLTYQLKKGQKPAKMVYKGSKPTSIDIPFRFKDIAVPVTE